VGGPESRREHFRVVFALARCVAGAVLSHALCRTQCSPCYASLSDNERNEMRELVLRVVSVRLYDSLLPPAVPPLRDETFAMRAVLLTIGPAVRIDF